MKKQEEAEDFINLGVVVNGKKEVLMIKRKKIEAGKNGSVLKWAFPGGKQKYAETRKQCVEREILSETGYDVNWIKEISMRLHPEIPVFIVYHLCSLRSEEPIARPKEPHEIAEVKWIKKEDIKNLVTTNLDPGVSRELKLK